MRKINSFFAAVVTLLGAAAVSSCVEQYEDRGNTPDGGLQTVEFGATVTEVTDYTATVHVTQTNCEEAGWFGFVTDDLTSDPADLVDDELSAINVTVNTLNHGDKDVELADLLAGKDYRYIVTGLLPNGVAYKEPVVAEFKTTGDFIYHSLTRDENIKVEYKGTTAASTVLGVEGAPEKYGLVVVPASRVDVDKDGEYIAEDYIFAYIDAVQSAAAAGKVSVSDFIFTAQGDVPVSPIEYNMAYVALCFGVTDNYNATGTYNIAEIADVTVDYEDFLGEWDFTRTDGDVTFVDHLSITPDEEGESYTVEGSVIDGNPFTYVADYEFGRMVVKSQVVDEWTHSKYGPIKDYLIGTVISEGKEYFITGNGYTVTDVTLDKSGAAPVATFNGGSRVNIGGLGACEIVSMTFVGTVSSGQIAFAYNQGETNAYFPTTMVKTGEYVPSEGPTYDSMLGVWAYADESLGAVVPIMMTENKPGASYYMYGWQGLASDDLAVTVDYAGEGLAGIRCSASIPVATGVEMLGGSYTVLLLGTIVDEEGEFPVSGNYYGGILKMTGADEGQIIPNALTLQGGAKYPVHRVQYYFIDEETEAMFTVASPDALPYDMVYFGSDLSSTQSTGDRIAKDLKDAELVPVKGFKSLEANSLKQGMSLSNGLPTAEFVK